MTRALAAGLLALSLFTTVETGGAKAESAGRCGNPKEVMQYLLQQYGEKPAFSGALQTGNPFAVTVGPKGTWTLLVMRGDGLMCAVTAGNEWKTAAGQGPTSSS